MSTHKLCFEQKHKQEAHGPRFAHLSDKATADMQMLSNIFPILSSQLMKISSFEQFLAGFRGKAIWNYQLFSIKMYGAHTNAYRSKLDLAVKRLNVNVWIILATLVDRPFQMIYAKIQPQAILGFGE